MFFFGVVIFVEVVLLVVGLTTFLVALNQVVGPGGINDIDAILTSNFFDFPSVDLWVAWEACLPCVP